MGKDVIIHATATDGNCLANYVVFQQKMKVFKTMPCKVKLDLHCVGKVGFTVPKVRKRN
jgi:hypothetical protein